MGQWSKIELPCSLKIFYLGGWWAVGLLLKTPLRPDRLCHCRAEVGLWHSGSVVNDRAVMLFENLLTLEVGVLLGCF